MLTALRPAVVFLGAMTFLTGVVYPETVTAIAQITLPRQANGSLIRREGRVVGSSLLGQPFDDPRYLWGRLSATTPYPYNASASSGSNLGPSSDDLRKNADARRAALLAADPTNPAPIPVDLLTASGSGLDPHISPTAAHYQIRRVARARGVDEQRLHDLIAAHTRGPQLGILSEPVVNVLQVNLALDDVAPLVPAARPPNAPP